MFLGYTLLIVFTLWLVSQLCPTLSNSMDCSRPGSFVHGNSPGKNTGVGFHALLQGIFPTQGLNPGLPHCRQILYHLSHQGNTKLSILFHLYCCVSFLIFLCFLTPDFGYITLLNCATE